LIFGGLLRTDDAGHATTPRSPIKSWNFVAVGTLPNQKDEDVLDERTTNAHRARRSSGRSRAVRCDNHALAAEH